MSELKKKFGSRNNETMKVAELKKGRARKQDDGEVCSKV